MRPPRPLPFPAFVVLSCSALLAACQTASYGFVPASSPAILYTGRFDQRKPDAPRAAWPGVQIEARFSGPLLRAVITDTPTEDETRETDWIEVTIDHGRPRVFALAEGRHFYPLAAGLGPGEHHVKIWKRTEAEVGVITFEGFELAPGHGLLQRVKAPALMLLMVGDSITAGYGNEGTSSSCHFSARTENAASTYGAFAARELDASYTAIAWSGKGLTRNYDVRDRETLPEVYDRVIPTEPAAGSVRRGENADVVVVNAGTNDFFAGMPDSAALSHALLELLERVRKQNPHALIVLAVGPMLADDYPQPQARTRMRSVVQAVLSSLRERGDAELDFLELWIDPAEGVGCDFHPNTKTHARLGRELAVLLRTRLGR